MPHMQAPHMPQAGGGGGAPHMPAAPHLPAAGFAFPQPPAPAPAPAPGGMQKMLVPLLAGMGFLVIALLIILIFVLMKHK